MYILSLVFLSFSKRHLFTYFCYFERKTKISHPLFHSQKYLQQPRLDQANGSGTQFRYPVSVSKIHLLLHRVGNGRKLESETELGFKPRHLMSDVGKCQPLFLYFEEEAEK